MGSQGFYHQDRQAFVREQPNIQDHYFSINDKGKINEIDPSLTSYSDLERNSNVLKLTNLEGNFDAYMKYYRIWLYIWSIIDVLTFTYILLLYYPSRGIMITSAVMIFWVCAQYLLQLRAISLKNLKRARVAIIMMAIFVPLLVTQIVLIRANFPVESDFQGLYDLYLLTKRLVIFALCGVCAVLIAHLITLGSAVWAVLKLKEMQKTGKWIARV